MKKILLATTILAASAGFASAEVALSGSAYMGLMNDFGAGDDTIFVSQARVEFTLSGETDGGLAFGASFRTDNARNDVGIDVMGNAYVKSNSANNGTAGSVYISGAFGKLSMGDVDGAAVSAVPQVSYVGLTSLGSFNELWHIGTGGGSVTNGSGTSGTSDDPSLLYEYSAGDLSVYVSATNPSGSLDAYGVGVKYAMGNYSVGLAFEQGDLPTGPSVSQVTLGGSATFGAATIHAGFVQTDFGGAADTANDYALSIDYVVNAATVTAYYTDREETGGRAAYGLGVAYDLGGGAKVMAGYVHLQESTTYGYLGDDAFDLGVSMSF